MRRITTQLVVALLVTVAFVLTAASGLVMLLPGWFISVSASGYPSVFGVPLFDWRAIHKWSALILTVAVLAHLVLNWRAVAEMVSRLARPGGARQAPSTLTPSPSPDARQDLSTRVATTPDMKQRLRLSRRWFLLLAGSATAAVIAALGLDHLGLHLVGSRRTGSGPASLLEDFPVLNVERAPPAVAAPSWMVEVDGLVDKTLHLDRTAWLALPRTQETRDFHCVEGWSVDHLGWEGVRVAELLSLAKPQAAGQFVTFYAYGGTYADSLTLAEAQAPETLLADSLDGDPLPAAHGGPLRLVIPSQLGYKNVKWVVRLEVTATRAQGYWEKNGLSGRGAGGMTWFDRHGPWQSQEPVPSRRQ